MKHQAKSERQEWPLTSEMSEILEGCQSQIDFYAKETVAFIHSEKFDG